MVTRNVENVILEYNVYQNKTNRVPLILLAYCLFLTLLRESFPQAWNRTI
jgi:hypothetical protein